jgi:hypothetical protein
MKRSKGERGERERGGSLTIACRGGVFQLLLPAAASVLSLVHEEKQQEKKERSEEKSMELYGEEMKTYIVNTEPCSISCPLTRRLATFTPRLADRWIIQLPIIAAVLSFRRHIPPLLLSQASNREILEALKLESNYW